jgi:hypothetical protein
MLRFSLGCLLGLSLVLLAAPRAHSQNPPVRSANTAEAPTPGLVCKVHALAELADDPNLCKWIADTIPAVIQPGTWNQGTEAATPGQCAVRFYAPAKILVVSHTPLAQAQVDAFLASVKMSLPAAKMAKTPETGIMQASYAAPTTTKRAEPTAVAPFNYPVPTAAKGPKHLFHFIIRYEGDGVIDSNIVEFTKAMQSGASMVREMPMSTTTPQALTPESAGTVERVGVDFNSTNGVQTVLPPSMAAMPLPPEAMRLNPPAPTMVPVPPLSGHPNQLMPPQGPMPKRSQVAPMPPVVAY